MLNINKNNQSIKHSVLKKLHDLGYHEHQLQELDKIIVSTINSTIVTINENSSTEQFNCKARNPNPDSAVNFECVGQCDMCKETQLFCACGKPSESPICKECFIKGLEQAEAEELATLRQLAHQGLPDECVKGWYEYKFCENRQGDGNVCKLCSHFE